MGADRKRVPVWQSIRHHPLAERAEALAIAIWNHRWFTLVLLFLSYAAAVWIWINPQLPGVAAVALGGIAAIVAFRDMHHTHKLLFTLCVIVLICLELKDIRADRAATDRQALDDRKKQDTSFKEIREKQDQDFEDTVEGLKAAIRGIDSTLRSADETLKQTRPYASIALGRFSIENAPQPPAMFSANVEYSFNCDFKNEGNDDAKILKSLRRVYVDKPDDQKAQERLAKRFDQEWSKTPRDKTPSYLPPHHDGFQTERRTFVGDEVERLLHGETIYILRRMEYADRTGRWFAENCQHVQVTESAHSFDIRVAHACLLFLGNRLPAH